MLNKNKDIVMSCKNKYPNIPMTEERIQLHINNILLTASRTHKIETIIYMDAKTVNMF